MTERDPGRTAELLRSGFDARLVVDDDARRRSFDAALAAFDSAATEEGEGPSVVIDLESRDAEPRPRRNGLGPVTALSVAALVLALVGAVVVLTRGGDERVRTGVADDPVDPPAPTVSVPVDTGEVGDWSSWADAADPAEALACVTGAAFRESVSAELPPPNPVGPDPESHWSLAQVRGVVGLGVTLAPVVSPASIESMSRAADLVAAADIAAFADEGSPDETFGDEVIAVRDAVASDPLWAPSPDRCWLDRVSGEKGIAALRSDLGAETVVRCLAAETVDRALAWQAADLETDRTGAINDALLFLTNYTSSADLQLLSLLGELSLLDPAVPDAVDAIQAARDDLAGTGLGLAESACRTP